MMSEFKRFPKTWKVLPFSTAIKDITGGNPKVKSGDYQEKGALAVVDQGQTAVAGYVDDETLACNASLPAIIFGDHTKALKFIEHPFALGADGIKVLEPIEGLDKRFVYHYLNQLALPDNAGYSRHFKFLKEKFIPLPPLPEQRRIAAILDKTDVIRRKRQQAICLTEEFLRSVFLDMFGDPVMNPKGWEVKRLDEISDIQSGITKGRKANGQEMLSVPYMRVANVQDGYIDLGEIKEIEATSTEIARYLLKKDDILLTEGGDPDKLGRGAVWHREIATCIHQNHIFRVRPNIEYLLPEYASAQIGSIRGKKYFLKSAKQTTGIASINKTQLSGFPVLIPPVTLQEKFVEIVRKQKGLVTKNSESATNKDDYFNSLIQRAFRGDL